MKPANCHKNKWKFDFFPPHLFICIVPVITVMSSNYSRRVIKNSGLTDISNHPGFNAALTALVSIIAGIFMGIVICFLVAVLYNMFRKKTDKKTGL
jgi:hypothetical protein